MNYKSDYNIDDRLYTELKRIIISSQGRSHTDRLVELMKEHAEWHNDLIHIYLSNEEPVSRRIAWAIDLYTIENPEMIHPYLETIAGSLRDFQHDALRRHSLHILSRSDLPSSELGNIINICFEWLLSPDQNPAVKVHCMEILFRVSLSETSLKQELADCIEFRFNEETPGFKNRGLKILKRLSLDPAGDYGQ